MQHFVGLMSGTSLDGIDAALVAFEDTRCNVVRTHYQPYPDDLREALLALHVPSANELEQSQIVAARLARLNAEAVHNLLGPDAPAVLAIGSHGQTIRHRPELGFTLQLNNPALLAELTGLSVIADFRSRDIAAGGQGAPLVPAFHQAMFGDTHIHRVIINIGGISNLTNLPTNGKVIGFDTGPGNLLMDAWCLRHTGQNFDRDGAWGATGQVDEDLLQRLLSDDFLALPPPKSTGRDTFNMNWLEHRATPGAHPCDVQRTLTEFTAVTIADAVQKHCSRATEIYLCGGGAHNRLLQARIQALLPDVAVQPTDALGIPVDWVEAVAFAWLAKRTLEGKAGNLPAATGAAGPRILGALYPA